MVKAAIFPLHIWLPSAYTFAPSAVAVLLTATATKAALYVLARILFTLLFNADEFTVIILQWVLLPASIVAIFFGTIRAIFEKDIKKLNGKEVLVLSVDSDVCFYPEEQTELVDILELNDVCVNYSLLHSDKGHDAFLLEPDIFFEPISTYL